MSLTIAKNNPIDSNKDFSAEFKELRKNNLQSDLNSLKELFFAIDELMAELKKDSPAKEKTLQFLKNLGEPSLAIRHCEADPEVVRNKYGYINREKFANGRIQPEGIYFDVLATLQFITDFDDIQDKFIHILFKDKTIYLSDLETINRKVKSIIDSIWVSHFGN